MHDTRKIKRREDAGADQTTPSIPQYFSWVNNTNEGSTEEQTHINLNFFDYLRRTYGMEIKIYAWDAGNFDGSANGYGDENGEKFRSQYPRGWAPIAEHAANLGIRMGLWGGPDGFGNTPEEEEKRFTFYADLCRKYHFALFKLDGVCGVLRAEKASVFADLLRECRKYSPDLIVLNHRLNLYEAEPHVTTFLWQGAETYVDVHSANGNTGSHHRCFIFDRGLPDDLERLAEDHGVCISSCPDYFDDDLIYQAFGRCMILSPEIYGNPWFLRDDEYACLAYIFNLHKLAAPILVNGLKLPESMGVTQDANGNPIPGANPVSRGTDSHRFIVTGNNTWNTHVISLALDETVGLHLPKGTAVRIVSHHPTTEIIGDCHIGDTVSLTLEPFRAHLLEIAPKNELYAMPTLPTKKLTPPKYLGQLSACDMPENAGQILEAALFGIDNDSLEARAIRRSGETGIPEVQAARDAFFAQQTYKARGCEGGFAFDGNPDTFFDGYSRFYFGGLRHNGGCLRVDFGAMYDADTVEIECFSIDTPVTEVLAAQIPTSGQYSEDLAVWMSADKTETSVINAHCKAPVVTSSVHTIYEVDGKRLRVQYKVGALRYFLLPEPMDRIYAIRLYKNGTELTLANPRVNNLQSPPDKFMVQTCKTVTLTLPEITDGQMLALAADGFCGNEALWCAAEIDGEYRAFPDRASSYRANIWEHYVNQHKTENFTYYLPLTSDDSHKTVTLYALFCDCENPEHAPTADCRVWLCDTP
ncbi:MAG: hypothetical protein IKV66_09355 [Clostridia bacterium]|nr:hypothetical protein [Clostridia bacterium]